MNTSLRARPDLSGIYIVPNDVIWVRSDQDFLKKVSLYNDVINNVSREVLRKRGDGVWKDIASYKQAEVIRGTSPDYLVKLASIASVVTILMAWTDPSGLGPDAKWTSTLDKSNLLIQDYYPYTTTEELCKNIRRRDGFTRHRYDTVYNHKCSTNISDAFHATSMELSFLNSLQIQEPFYWPNGGAAWPSHFYTDIPRFVTYLHILQDGILNNLGQVLTGKYKVIPFNCRPVFSGDVPQYKTELPLHQQVFSLSQYWGDGFYHKNLEDFPKLAPYLDFLVKNPDIKIHVFERGTYTKFAMETLGIDPSRLISGDIRAHVIYLPRGTSCGFTHIQEAQLLSHKLREATPVTSNRTRNLVLIRRTGHRSFTKHAEIDAKMKAVARDFGLQYYLFKDNPSPPPEEAMREFNRAAIVVGPHGAGLSNLLFSTPGTMVVEGLCNPPHINMCYTRAIYILGLRYHGLISHGGCEGHVVIPPDELDRAVRNMLLAARSSDAA